VPAELISIYGPHIGPAVPATAVADASGLVPTSLAGVQVFFNSVAMPLLSDRFTQALAYAAELHQEQIRKGSGIPYVGHLLGVASLALDYGADEDEAIAALLHDAIEDQGGAATREDCHHEGKA
jgi:(p)ppGpp synthase/HD superfamily hydrolase